MAFDAKEMPTLLCVGWLMVFWGFSPPCMGTRVGCDINETRVMAVASPLVAFLLGVEMWD